MNPLDFLSKPLNIQTPQVGTPTPAPSPFSITPKPSPISFLNTPLPSSISTPAVKPTVQPTPAKPVQPVITPVSTPKSPLSFLSDPINLKTPTNPIVPIKNPTLPINESKNPPIDLSKEAPKSPIFQPGLANKELSDYALKVFDADGNLKLAGPRPNVQGSETRPQDFKDVANLIVTAPDTFMTYTGSKDIVRGIISLGQSILQGTGKEKDLSFNIPVPFPHNQTVQDGDFSKLVPVEKGAVFNTIKKSYQDNIDNQTKAGGPVSEKTAFWWSVLDTVGSMAMIAPIAKIFAGNTIKTEFPEKLITPEIVKASKEQIFDFLSGRTPQAENPLPPELKQAIKEKLSVGTPEEQRAIIRGAFTGIDMTQAKPSLLGKMVGISQEQADKILADLYGKGVRQAPAGALPGYRMTGQEGGINAKGEPVGFNKESPPLPENFQGFKDISTNVLGKLEGRGVVSKQFISDLTNSPELKNAERELIRNVLNEYPENKDIPVKEFADKVHSELLPLERVSSEHKDSKEGTIGFNTRYEDVALPHELRGPVASYSEHVFESPIKTSYGDVHFGNSGEIGFENYFAHSRIEDLPTEGHATNPRTGKKGAPVPSEPTRRIIELQSDLFQKGRLENELGNKPVMDVSEVNERTDELKKLEPYRNTWQDRIIREEVKQAAIDGKTKLQFPTGETAMKIEGLGSENSFRAMDESGAMHDTLKPEGLRVGRLIGDRAGHPWVITKVLDNGRFEAVPKRQYESIKARGGYREGGEQNAINDITETFDVTGKDHTNDPIYKFYEKEVGRYLKNKYDAKLITDPQGVKWWEVNVHPKMANEPIIAFQKGNPGKPNITKAEAMKIMNSIFKPGEVKLVFDENLMKKEGAYGLFISGRRSLFGVRIKPMISLLEENGMVHDKTLYHEAFHAHFNTYLTNSERAAAIEKVKANFLTKASAKAYPKASYPTEDARAEEWLADDFAEYVKGDTEYKGFFAKLWEKLLTKVRDLIRKANKFDELYQNILKEEPKAGEEKAVVRAQAADEKFELSKEERINQEKTIKEQKKLDIKTSKTNRAEQLSPKEQKLWFLRQQRSDLLSRLAENPARHLMKYVSGQTGELPEINTFEGKFNKRGDVIMKELGFDDIEDANKAVRSYKKTTADLRELNAEVVKVRNEVTAEKISEKEKKSTEVLLNKKTTQAEQEMVEQQRKERGRLAEEAAQKTIKKNQAIIDERNRRTNEAFQEAKKSKNIITQVKQLLKPIEHVDLETKGILSDWYTKKLVAKDMGEQTYREMATKGPQNFSEIDKYEAGKQTPYIREALDSLYTEAKRADLDIAYRENYLPHVYMQGRDKVMQAIKDYLKAKGMSEKEINAYITGEPLSKDTSLRLKLTPNFIKERIFPTYEIARQYGLTPKYKTPAQLIGYYREALDTAMANREVIDRLKTQIKLLPSDEAPDTWEPVTTRFARGSFSARPELAKLINGQFRDEEHLPFTEKIVKGIAKTSRLMQEVVLSAGIPFTNVNFFSIGQAVKLLHTSLGDVALFRFKDALSDLKSSFAFIRSNSNYFSAKWFYNNRAYIVKAAEHGIDLSDRVGNYRNLYRKVGDLFPDKSVKGAAIGAKNLLGRAWHKAFEEKVFNSMMPQITLQMFKDIYNSSLAKGISDYESGKLAGDITRKFQGMIGEVGRAKATDESLSSLFFAPKFREGLVNIFVNVLKAISPLDTSGPASEWKFSFKNIKDPSNRRLQAFVVGSAIVYGLYNYQNKKNTGHYMWDNPPGKQFSLGYKLPDGNIAYLDFLPSLFAFPRVMVGGAIAFGQGDIKTGIQQFGSVFSMPLRLATEILGNSDFYGRPIYKDTDTTKEKAAAISKFLLLNVNHPYVKEAVNYLNAKEPLYQALSIMLELPIKWSSKTKEDQAAYYNMLDKQTKIRTQAKNAVKKIYDSNQQLKADGKIQQANKIYYTLPSTQKKLYNEIKADEKRSVTAKRKPAIQAIYTENQRLISEGNRKEANRIYGTLNKADKAIYQTLKNKSKFIDELSN